MSTIENVYEAIGGEWATEMETGLSIPTAYGPAFQNPPSGVVYAIHQIQTISGARRPSAIIGDGKGRPRMQGLQVVNLYAPADLGRAAALAVADQILDHYDGLSLSATGVDSIEFRVGDAVANGTINPRGLLEVAVTHEFYTDQQ